MWREPKLNELDGDTETKNLIAKSIYFNRKGVLREADKITQIQYSLALFGIWIMSSTIMYVLLSFLFGFQNLNFLTFMMIFLLTSLSLLWYINWGWYRYEQAWYYFDEKNAGLLRSKTSFQWVVPL